MTEINYPGRLLALIGGMWGVIGAVMLGTLRTVLGANNGAPLPDSLPGDVVFGLVYLLPFALAIAALRGAKPAQRAAAWISAGVMALVLSFTAFSGVSLIFLPAAPFLLIAGVKALPGIETKQLVVEIGAALLLIALEFGAFWALFLREDMACWDLVREPSGVEHWVAAPYQTEGVFNEPGSVVSTQCTSDTFSAVEILASLGLLLLASGGWIAAGRVGVSPGVAIGAEAGHP